jgi:ADP-ribose pyrophosphatase YjhB (NUDIX family)
MSELPEWRRWAGRIRPIVRCVLRRGEAPVEILVAREDDPERGTDIWFPPGGGMDFGETAEEALRRELREELGAEIESLRLLGVLEPRFEYAGEQHHHLVMIYEGAFSDPAMYDREDLVVSEPTVSLPAEWRPLADFAKDRRLLMPLGLYDLLASASSR